MVEKQINKKIRDSNAADIRVAIDKLRDELRNLRNAKATSGRATKLSKIKGVRKNIARNLTALNQKERANAAGNLHAHSKKRATFLREKLTRAYRRRLTGTQKHKKILKVAKRAQNFPLRKYGIKA